MGYSVIRYQVKDAALGENRLLIEKVFEQLAEAVPEGLGYLVLELENGEFMHIVRTADDGTSPLPGLSAFRAFTEGHAERRATPVARSLATVLGNHRMLVGNTVDA